MANSHRAAEEQLIDRHIELISADPPVTLAGYAREHGLPYERLRNRLKGRPSLLGRRPNGRRLDDAQEIALCRWLDRCDRIGLSARFNQVESTANFLIHLTSPDSPPVGPHWTTRFLQRFPQYHVMKQKTLESEHKAAHDPAAIFDWYERLKALITKEGIQKSDVYNMDETGFRVGVGRDQWIVTREVCKQSYIASTTERALVTVIEAISAGGFVIDPLVIIPGKIHQASWYSELDDGYSVSVSETGYSNDLIAVDWIRHFEARTRSRTVGKHRLLLLDNHGSHVTYPFLKFCEQNSIIIFALPPHTSHLMQPLDVTCFQQFKHFHSVAIDAATRTGCTDFTKLEFLHALTSIRAETFKQQTILSGFRDTGIFPWNPEVVLNKLLEHRAPLQSRWHSPPPQLQGASGIPHTPRALKRQADALEEELAPLLNTPYRQKLHLFSLGAQVQSLDGKQAQQELQIIQREKKERLERRNRSRRAVQLGGTLTVKDGRRIIEKQVEDKEKAAKEVLKRWDERQQKEAEKRRKQLHLQIRRLDRFRRKVLSNRRRTLHQLVKVVRIIDYDEELDNCHSM